MEGYRNPVASESTDLYVRQPPLQNEFGRLSTHIVTVDSRDRNRSVFPNANNFRIELPLMYRNVSSLELRRFMMPVPAAIATEPYVILRVGDHSNRLERAVAPGRSNTITTGTSAQDVPQDRVWGNPGTDQAYGVIPLRITSGIGGGTNFLLWEASSDQRIAKHYRPVLTNLKYLHVEIFTRGNVSGTGAPTPVPLTADSVTATDATVAANNIYLEFEIHAQS